MSRRRPRSNPSSARSDELRVNAYSAKWVRKGFPWVYPKELTHGRIRASGVEVEVKAPDGKVLGRALTEQSFLAARIYRHGEGPLDQAWAEERVDRALRLRRSVLPPETTAWRVLHGENDGVPGIRVDFWDGHLSIALDSPAVRPALDLLLPVLRERLDPASAWLCYRPDPRDERPVSSFSPAPGVLWGERSEADIVVLERGMRIAVRPWEGPDTGLYCDMRSARRWLEPLWKGRRVLNTFAYTGAFSVAAARAGAEEVVTVDLGRPALDRAMNNFRLNDLADDPETFLAEDTFRALDRFRRKGRRFDLALADPPSFSHGPGGTWSVSKDMPRLVAALARVLDPGGLAVVASNHGQTSPKAFRGMVSDGFARAGRRAAEIAWLSPSPDFPAAVSFPEAHYLKVGVWALD